MKPILYWLCFLLFITGTACSQNNSTMLSSPSSNIEFSQPPIDLKDLNVKFARDIAYDIYDETVFDVFLPASTKPTGMVIYIHGGGFRGGDKDYIYKPSYTKEVKTFLANNISVATINYRLLNKNEETEGILKSLNDAKRAIQFIRGIATDLNIDKKRIVLTGNSAGAGVSLWIAVNDDMQDKSASDIVLHESTRVKAVALRQTQSSYDIEGRWINEVFADYNVTFHEYIAKAEFRDKILKFYGVNSLEEYNSPQIEDYRKKVDMLALITSDDPAIWAENIKTDVAPPKQLSVLNHHAFHVREIKEKADAAGVPNVCYYGKQPIIYQDPSNEPLVSFLIRKLNE